jgi:hypothetical protein
MMFIGRECCFMRLCIVEEEVDVKEESKSLKEKEWLAYYKGLWNLPHRDEQNKFK